MAKQNGYNCTLMPDVLKKSKKELNEDPSTRHIEIQTIRERLNRYPGLMACVDDKFIIKFLRAGKFDQERAFALILNYYKMKKDHEDLYAQMTPSKVKHMFDDGVVNVLMNSGKNGETVIFSRAGRWDAEKYPMDDAYKMMYLTLSTIIESEEAQVHGIIFIDDQSGLNFSHMKRLNPSAASRFGKLLQDCFPMRLKKLVFLHQPTFFDALYLIIKPFIKEKLSKRLIFAGDKVNKLTELIDKDKLPEEYGGTMTNYQPQEFIDKIMAREAEFEAETKLGFVDMALKNVASADAIEKLPGTFKKLNVD